MKLRGLNFGRVLCSSGSLGFFGDGYWYHKAFRPIGLNYEGATFVSKTTTLLPRKGNMPLKADQITPSELVPKCVKVRWSKGVVLNSVGLSGPGAKWLIQSGRWQRIGRPFFISFMSVGQDPTERLDELRKFVNMLLPELPKFRTTPGLELNFSCPNVGVNHSDGLVKEVVAAMEVASILMHGKRIVPLVPNFSPDISPEAVFTIAQESVCDAVSISNTVRWGNLPDQIDWKGIWGSHTSPLSDLGGGGLSGAPLLPIVLQWARRARELGFQKPLIMGGGILSAADAMAVLESGAAAIKLGVVGMLRPWRVRGIIQRTIKSVSDL